MNELQACIHRLSEEYPDASWFPCVCDDARADEIKGLPAPLREFYRHYDGADLPFGHIFSLDDTLHDPIARQAFGDEWVQFGCDEYFTFWLCRPSADGEGLWLVPWDHDSETDIEAVYADLPAFLYALAEEYDGFEA